MKTVGFLWLVALCSMVASAARAQDRPRSNPPPEKWITADSLATALGVTDTALVAKLAPHLAAVDKVLKDAADERRHMREQFRSGGQPDRDAMRSKMMGFQTQIDEHLAKIRDLLDQKQKVVFDQLEKPSLRPRRM